MTEQLAHHPQRSVVVKGRAWPIRELAEVTGRRIGPTPLPGWITRCSLPTVAEWTGRDVWLPPTPAGVRR